jgi:miniconductance mechanosensitive channel
MFTEFTISHINGYSYLITIVSLIVAGIGFILTFSHLFAKYVLISWINKYFDKKRHGLGQIIYNNNIFHRIAYLIPALLLRHFSYLFDIRYPHLQLLFSELVIELTNIYLIIGVAFLISAILNTINDRYNQLSIAKQKPIKSYLQVAKIFLFCITSVFVASLLFDKSPTYFFTGVGAATAFLALLFKDSMMGFIASIQLAAYDMVRIGDWIEMPQFGVDGEVMDISLNTVKVQNFDNTIVTIPSYALLTSGLKNWRGMQESGGRRIKRSIHIDITSIKTCEQPFLEKLYTFDPMIQSLVASLQNPFNTTTNLGLFRLYLEKILKQHPQVHQKMKLLIRQLQGTPTGLPLELYFFTNQTRSEKYESVQADMLEHVYALLPQFGLRVFQYANSPEG